MEHDNSAAELLLNDTWKGSGVDLVALQMKRCLSRDVKLSFDFIHVKKAHTTKMNQQNAPLVLFADDEGRR